MNEMSTPIEPNVTEKYLKSSALYVSPMEKLLNDLPDKYNPVEFSLPALEATPFKAVCYGRRLQAGIYTVTSFDIDLVTKNGNPINSGHNGIHLEWNEGLSTITGKIYNDTHRKYSSERAHPPLRNLSGILAPLEDAFCQAAAITMSTDIVRSVKTTQPLTSRLVQNYRVRGYELVKTEDQTTTLVKRFTDSSPNTP